jgi:hypothetical protein
VIADFFLKRLGIIGEGHWLPRDEKIKEKGPAIACKPLNLVAPQPGLEPGTYGLTVRRSTN